MLGLPPTEKMPTEQDQYDVCIDLVTMAGTEYTMQTNITHYEDMMQLEDDILCFLLESLESRVPSHHRCLCFEHHVGGQQVPARPPGIPCMFKGQARVVRLVALLYATFALVKHS